MPIPSVIQTITDGALGIVQPSGANTQVKIGVCSRGIVNTVQSFSDVTLMKNALGRGPMVEAGALAMKSGPVIFVPVNPSVAGAVGAVTQEGTGAGTIAVVFGPETVIRVKIVTGGALGTMQFQTSVNGGVYSSTQTSGAGAPHPYKVPGTLSTLSFAAGTYVLNDIYTLNLDGTVTLTGGGPAAALNGSIHNPLDTYDVRVKIGTAGAAGVGTFARSLDGGNNYSAQVLIPSSGRYAIPDTGVVLTFSGTFVKDDVYKFATTAMSYATGDATAAIDALLLSPLQWFLLHVVGKATTAAGAASLAAAVDAKVQAAEAAFRYVRALVECPHDADVGGSVNDAAVISAFAAFSSTNGRTSVAVGDVGLISPLTGRTDRRCVAWPYAARLSAISPGEDPAWVGRGSLENVTSIYRNEESQTALNDQRFVTARTLIGTQGYFVTKGKTMAPGGSDYHIIQNGRVMDIACAAARARLLRYLNGSVRVNKDGTIDERDAQKIEADTESAVKAAVVAPGMASEAKVVLSRTANILSTSTQPVTTRVRPLAYLEFITNDIGFVNPALAA